MPLDRRLRDELHRAARSIEPDTEARLESVVRRSERSRGLSGALLVAATAVLVLAAYVAVRPDEHRQVGPGDGQTASPAVQPTPVASERASALTETAWTVTLTDADPGVMAPAMSGEWTMRLGPDSRLELTAPTTFVAPSSRAPSGYVYVVREASLLTNLFARDFSESCTGSGTYDWAIAGGRLTLAAVEDTCDARRALLAARPWAALR